MHYFSLFVLIYLGNRVIIKILFSKIRCLKYYSKVLFEIKEEKWCKLNYFKENSWWFWLTYIKSCHLWLKKRATAFGVLHWAPCSSSCFSKNNIYYKDNNNSLNHFKKIHFVFYFSFSTFHFSSKSNQNGTNWSYWDNNSI